MPVVPPEGSEPEDRFVSSDDQSRSKRVFGTAEERSILDCIADHEFLKDKHSDDEILSWAREWTREDAVRERTRRVFKGDFPKELWDLLNDSLSVFNGPTESELRRLTLASDERSLGLQFATIVGLGQSDKLRELALVLDRVKTSQQLPFEEIYGKVILIFNAELRNGCLIDKQTLWERSRVYNPATKLKRFRSYLKWWGLNGLPGKLKEDP